MRLGVTDPPVRTSCSFYTHCTEPGAERYRVGCMGGEPGLMGMQMELPGRRAWPGGQRTARSVAPGELDPGAVPPGIAGIVLPGVLGVLAPGVLGVALPGIPGLVVPVPAAPGVCAAAAPARARLVATTSGNIFLLMTLMTSLLQQHRVLRIEG